MNSATVKNERIRTGGVFSPPNNFPKSHVRDLILCLIDSTVTGFGKTATEKRERERHIGHTHSLA